MWSEKEAERLLEKEIEKNSELAKLFKEYPEKKKEYLQKVLDSEMGGGGMKPSEKCSCDTCRFAESIEPIGRQPRTPYCDIYGVKDSKGKPEEVLYNGSACEYYEKLKK